MRFCTGNDSDAARAVLAVREAVRSAFCCEAAVESGGADVAEPPGDAEDGVTGRGDAV
jgi:hypothetical protein